MMRNLPLKALSVLIAVLLAFAVHSASNTSVVSLVVPIELQNPPEEKILVRPIKRAVQVTVKGPSFLIGPIVSSPPTLRVKLPKGEDDRFRVNLKSSDLSLPAMVDGLSVEPPEMEFVFEVREKREVKVEVPRVGQLPKDLVLEKIEINPLSVTVMGPRSEIKLLRAVETEPIDLQEIDSSRTLALKVRPPSAQVDLSLSSVSALISVGAVPRERMLDARPIEVRAAPGLPVVSLEPKEVAVVVEGDPSAVYNLSPSAVIPYVRVKDSQALRAGSAEVGVEVPSGLRLVSVDPKTVKLKVQAAGRVATKAPSSVHR
jgi:YbbR domain-containing protein